MISRRAILRGALGGSIVGLGLPLLEQMLNSHGTALAAGSALPKRYGLFFWGEGLPPNYRHNATTASRGQPKPRRQIGPAGFLDAHHDRKGLADRPIS